MFQPWRIQLREAEQAFQGGLLDEAQRLLTVGGLIEYLPGKKLSLKVANSLAKRGQQQAQLGDTSAGWRDLAAGSQLAGETAPLIRLRSQLIDQAMDEAERYLAGDDPVTAVERLKKLRGRDVDSDRVRRLMRAAQCVDTARRHARRGDFSLAETEFSRAVACRDDLETLDNRLSECRVKMKQHDELTGRMHAALAKGDWNSVIDASDQLLRLAPENESVRELRRRAWKAVGGGLRQTRLSARRSPNPVGASVKTAAPESRSVAAVPGRRRETSGQAEKIVVTTESENKDRFLMWIDAVGGFLVCLKDEIVLGQPVAGSQADVAILADISRRHAVIRREGENYTISPCHKVRLDGEPIVSTATLRDGCLIDLGDAVKIRFSRPNPLSTTARLDFVSHHRTQPQADAVLLMAATCILGPKPNSHVVCRGWTDDVILFRDGDQLICRSTGTLEIDGTPHQRSAPVTLNSRISSDDFSLSLENV